MGWGHLLSLMGGPLLNLEQQVASWSSVSLLTSPETTGNSYELVRDSG